MTRRSTSGCAGLADGVLQTFPKQLIAQSLQEVAGRAVSKQVLKFVPVIGWAVNAAIGFGAMKYVGNSHIDDCCDVCKKLIASSSLE